MYGTEYEQEVLLGINLLLGMEAIVAILAIVGFILFAEVMEEQLAATNRRFAIVGGFLEQLATDVLFGHRFAFHELLQLLEVLACEEGDASTFTSITPGTTRFLIITFEALGYVVMDDETHVGFVDAHAKGNRCHDDIDTLHDEVVLCLGAHLALKTCMVGGGLDVVGLENLGQFLHLLTAQAIDDAALAFVLPDEADDVLIDFLGLWTHFVIKVRAIER